MSRSVLLFVLSTLLLPVTKAQITNGTNGQTTPTPGVGHEYIGTVNDIVDPSNGSLSIRIDVPTPPGRGFSLPFHLDYNSNGVIGVRGAGGGTLSVGLSDAGFAEQNGWRYGLPAMSSVTVSLPSNNLPQHPNQTCDVDTGFVLTDLDGSRHAFNLAVADLNFCENTLYVSPVTTYAAADLYGNTLSTPSNATNSRNFPFSARDISGTLYHFPGLNAFYCNGTSEYTDTCGLPDYIEDRNGNQITFTPNQQAVWPLTATDTLGRSLLNISGFGVNGNTISVAGLSGHYTIHWGTISWSTSSAISQLTTGDCTASTSTVSNSGTMSVISSIDLPNGQSYTFAYDAHGLLNKITYPTGATVSYTWGANTTSDVIAYPSINPTGAGCFARYATLAVQHRYVSLDGVHTTEQQDFSYSTTWPSITSTSWTQKGTNVTTKDLVRSGSPHFLTTHTYTGQQVNLPPNMSNPGTIWWAGPQTPQENVTTYQDWSGTTLKTVTKTWSAGIVASEQTALANNQTTKTAYTMLAPGLPIETDEYDFGTSAPGALLRKTVNTYQQLAQTPLGNYIYDRPCKTVVSDGSSHTLSETDIYYDGGTTLCSAPPVIALSGTGNYTGHDETLYGSGDPAARGNLTKKVVKCFVGAVTCADSITTYSYDETGQMLTMTDACGNGTCSDMPTGSHATTYSYTDSPVGGDANGQSNAFVTSVTDSLSHTMAYTYNYLNSKMLTSKVVGQFRFTAPCMFRDRSSIIGTWQRRTSHR